ncbi:MAG: glycosyltransferase family 4 protein [Vicinamibacteria bacterium]|nr:glycosyltransferase family 4 protein [Vicinamibacteria bacterium]
MRVCHLVATTLGARWMCEQLRELRDRHGYEVAAVVNGTQGPLVEWLKAERIPFHVWDFGLGAGPRPLALLRSLASLLRLLWRERFDVVQTHVFPSYLAVRPAAWIAGIPVRTAMISGPFHLEARLPRRIEQLTAWMDTALIPSCEKSRQLCLGLGLPEARLRLVYYAADESRFQPERVPAAALRQRFGWPEDAPVVGLVAYFYPRLGHSDWIPRSLQGRAIKGHEDFVRAAGRVLVEFPRARFVLVGGGFAGDESHWHEIRALVAELGLEGRVAMTGHEPRTQDILKDLTIAVQASLCENLGGTLEALAMARPMVATRVGGMVDVVHDGRTGLLAEPRNPRDLAEKILALLNDPALARELGESGRRLVLERFSLRRCVDDLDALYREQWASAPAGGALRLSKALPRTLLVVPWLALVWLRVTLLDDEGRGLRHGLAALPRRLLGIARTRGHLALGALQRCGYRAWVALAPGSLRARLRRLRGRPDDSEGLA